MKEVNVGTTLEKSILGSRETKGKSPYKRARWVCLRNSKRSMCLEHSNEGEKVQRGQGPASCQEFAGHGKGFGVYPKGDGLEQRSDRPDPYFKKVPLAAVWKTDQRRPWWEVGAHWETLAGILVRSTCGLSLYSHSETWLN